MSSLWLQALTTYLRGRAFELEEGREYVVGRTSESDLCFATPVVSRANTWITGGATSLRVADAASANGTFLGGRRVTTASHAVAGDTLLIGDVLLRVHGSPPAAVERNVWLGPERSEDGAPYAVHGVVTRRASLEQLTLPALLRLFAVLKRTGTYAIASPGHGARIDLVKGAISEVVVDGTRREDRAVALASLLTWNGSIEEEALPEGGRQEPLSLDEVLPPLP